MAFKRDPNAASVRVLALGLAFAWFASFTMAGIAAPASSDERQVDAKTPRVESSAVKTPSQRNSTEPATEGEANSRSPYTPWVDMPTPGDQPGSQAEGVKPKGESDTEGETNSEAVSRADSATAGTGDGKGDEGALLTPLTRDVASQFWFDAERLGGNRDLGQAAWEGNVVVIGAGTLIGADQLQLDRGTNTVHAQGHIVILNRRVIFIGDTVTYHLDTGDFVITNAMMVANDEHEIDTTTRRIFGFTPREAEFEEARKKRLAELNQKKQKLRLKVSKQGQVRDEEVDLYARLLESEALTSKQENPALAHLDPERREDFKRRRNFWEASKKSLLQVKAGSLDAAFLHLEGDELTRVNGNDYEARNALFTPCYCARDEKPAWAFRADKVDTQLGGYADLDHAVLEIKGIPVLYLPHLKIPIKDRRQSGFLPPTFSYIPRSGNTFTQPLFFDLAPNADATVTSDVYENRGTRLGIEYRLQQRQLSGWELKADVMRDRLWLEDRAVRSDLSEMIQRGLEASSISGTGCIPAKPELTGRAYARDELKDPCYWKAQKVTPSDPTSRQDYLNQVAPYLASPANSWRGSYSWRGTTYLAPRLSFVSNGEVTSDHRYIEELTVPDNFNQALAGGRQARAFSPAKAQFHLDAKDFYAGIGTRYGDNYLTDERYLGQQVPAEFTLQSRYFSLFPPTSLFKVYGTTSLEQVRIGEHARRSTQTSASSKPESLGDGDWRRLRFTAVSPLISDRIIQVSQFTEGEARYISHENLAPNRSEVRSWRTGVEFRLPIDGKGVLPAIFRSDPCKKAAPKPDASGTQADASELDCDDNADTEELVHHVMSWSLRLSARPVVARRGPYGEETANYYTYFASDKPISADPSIADLDRDVPEEERMQIHRRVTLATDHVWKLLRRAWERVPGEPGPEPKGRQETSLERARRELMAGLDRSPGDVSDLYDEMSARWLIDRYQLTENDYATPVTFHADTAYDFIDAEERKKQIAENQEAERLTSAGTPTAEPHLRLIEAWKPVNASLGLTYSDWTLGTGITYGIYRHAVTSEAISLTFPEIFQSRLGLGYTLRKEYDDKTQSYQRTATKSGSLNTNLIPKVTSFIRLDRRVIENNPPTYTATYHTAFGFKYASSSNCWGLQFAREKDFDVSERESTYTLQLSVIFMGQERPLPNMAKGVVREQESQRSL